MKNDSLKYKFLGLIIFLFLSSFIAFFYIFYDFQKQELKILKDEQILKIDNSFNKNIEKHLKNYYFDIARKIFDSEDDYEIKLAIKENDRKKLEKITAEKIENVTAEKKSKDKTLGDILTFIGIIILFIFFLLVDKTPDSAMPIKGMVIGIVFAAILINLIIRKFHEYMILISAVMLILSKAMFNIQDFKFYIMLTIMLI